MDPQPAGKTSGFIARHGLVKYSSRLRRRYPLDGECELCPVRRGADLDAARDMQRAAEERIREIRAMRTFGGQRIALLSEARDLECRLPGYKTLVALAGPPWEKYSACLIYEHCHLHRWVRGIACQSCNNALIPVEHGWAAAAGPGRAITVLRAYLANCPDCAPLYSEDARPGGVDAAGPGILLA